MSGTSFAPYPQPAFQVCSIPVPQSTHFRTKFEVGHTVCLRYPNNHLDVGYCRSDSQPQGAPIWSAWSIYSARCSCKEGGVGHGVTKQSHVSAYLVPYHFNLPTATGALLFCPKGRFAADGMSRQMVCIVSSSRVYLERP